MIRDQMEDLWAVVLAGGESRRMGTPKMLLPFRGATMLENVIGNIEKSGIKNILVVLGAEKERIAESVKHRNIETCYNGNYRDGMLSSVICGVGNVPGDADAILVFQGDEPLIKPSSINLVVAGYRSSGKGLVVPVYKKRRGHPLLISSRYLGEISNLDQGRGLRAITEIHGDDLLEVNTDDPGILKDFDTFEEYSKEINQKP
jgi:molybdenum cofactor cytidylyltransferase